MCAYIYTYIFDNILHNSPDKIVIKLAKLKIQNFKVKVSRGYTSISNKKHIQRKKSSKYAPIE